MAASVVSVFAAGRRRFSEASLCSIPSNDLAAHVRQRTEAITDSSQTSVAVSERTIFDRATIDEKDFPNFK